MWRLFVTSWRYYLIHNNSGGGEISMNHRYSPPQLQLDRTTRWYKGAEELRPPRSAWMRLLPASWIVSLGLGSLKKIKKEEKEKVKKNLCRGALRGSERRFQQRSPHPNSWTKPFTLLLCFPFTAILFWFLHWTCSVLPQSLVGTSYQSSRVKCEDSAHAGKQKHSRGKQHLSQRSAWVI